MPSVIPGTLRLSKWKLKNENTKHTRGGNNNSNDSNNFYENHY